MQKLKTSQENGLTPNDFNLRDEQFGSNFKAPQKMSPYWRLFLNALDDFMLKFLIVCACVQLAIEVGFSEPEKRGTGKSLLIQLYHLTTTDLCCSLGRGIRYLPWCIYRCWCWILE